MLGLLLWQMSQELRQQEGFEHERAAAQLDRLNDRLSLTLELKARTALALLPGMPPASVARSRAGCCRASAMRAAGAPVAMGGQRPADGQPVAGNDAARAVAPARRLRPLPLLPRPARRRIPLPDPARTRQPPRQWLLAVAPGQRQPRPVESRPAHRQPALAPGRPIRRAGALAYPREHGAARRHADPRRGTAAQQRLAASRALRQHASAARPAAGNRRRAGDLPPAGRRHTCCCACTASSKACAP